MADDPGLRKAREEFEEDERAKPPEVDFGAIQREVESLRKADLDRFGPRIRGGFIPPSTCPNCGHSL